MDIMSTIKVEIGFEDLCWHGSSRGEARIDDSKLFKLPVVSITGHLYNMYYNLFL